MPCLNEGLTVGTCIRKAFDTMEQLGIQGEVIVADNGSTDGSQSIAAELGARVVPIETRGYGSALRGGIAAARGRFVIMGDSDDSYDFTALGAFLSKLKEGADLVMGNRFLGNPGLSRLGGYSSNARSVIFSAVCAGFAKTRSISSTFRRRGWSFRPKWS
jgi:glycosyltransferase involved in cell wall biosynthesis